MTHETLPAEAHVEWNDLGTRRTGRVVAHTHHCQWNEPRGTGYAVLLDQPHEYQPWRAIVVFGNELRVLTPLESLAASFDSAAVCRDRNA